MQPTLATRGGFSPTLRNRSLYRETPMTISCIDNSNAAHLKRLHDPLQASGEKNPHNGQSFA